MAKYQVNGNTTISVYTIVEADSPEKALEIALERGFCSVDDPSSYGDKAENVWLHSGELDGEINIGAYVEEAEEE